MGIQDSPEEQAYVQGRRDAFTTLLRQAIGELGYDKMSQAAWISEREDTLRVLRRMCADFGDNDWNNDLYIPDILEKHLLPYLEEKA